MLLHFLYSPIQLTKRFIKKLENFGEGNHRRRGESPSESNEHDAPCRRGESPPETFFITMPASGMMCE
jgi:hypothetical protein